MIVLLPVETAQIISIMPRTELGSFGVIVGTDIKLVLTRDGDKATETIYPTLSSDGGYYTNLTIASSILTENETYYLEITNNGSLWYRDKVYVTAQSNYTIKHQISIPNYTPYSDTDDNTYII